MAEIVKFEDRLATPEELTIRAVIAAAEIAFDARGTGNMTVKQVCDLCCGIVRFLEKAAELPERSMADWKQAVERLHFTVGPIG